MEKTISFPLTSEQTRDLRSGDSVLINGVVVTARDAAHKWLFENFIAKIARPNAKDQSVYEALLPVLKGGAIFHCGPIAEKTESGSYHIVSAGPTTSMREEPYQADIIHHFGLRGIIGKGGMGKQTLAACVREPCIYLHAIGGTGALSAASIKEVLGVYKLEFGMPEAFWVIRIHQLKAVVTMDTAGYSLHDSVAEKSSRELARLLA